MAFMTPIVNKRYDLYESQKKIAAAQNQDQSMNLHLKSLKLVNKLVRLVINGNGKSGNLPKKTLEIPPTSKSTKTSPAPLSTPAAAVPVIKITSSPNKPTTPVTITTTNNNNNRKSSSTPAINIPSSKSQVNEKSINSSSTPSSKKSLSPPSISRPIPHLRRTLRDTATNRVYSYSVSIPNYVAEESEEDLEEEAEIEKKMSSSYQRPYHHHHAHFISSSAPNCSSSSGSTSFEDHQAVVEGGGGSPQQAAPH